MSIATSELQVSAGLANDYDLRTLHYGILLHWRRADGTGVREVFEYRAFVDSNTNPLRLNGIEPDDDRIDFERGHGTALDDRLVRRSAFRFAPKATPGQASGALQQVFAVLKPKKGSSFHPALGLKWVCGPDLPPRTCPPEGLPPIRVWYTDDWRDRVFVDEVPYHGDVTEWAEALGRRAEAAMSELPARGAPVTDLAPMSITPRSDRIKSPRPAASTVDVAAPVPIRVDDPQMPAPWKWSGKHTLVTVALVVVAGAVATSRWVSTSTDGNPPKPGQKHLEVSAERIANRQPPSVGASAGFPSSPDAIKLACKDDPFPLHCERNLGGQQGKRP